MLLRNVFCRDSDMQQPEVVDDIHGNAVMISISFGDDTDRSRSALDPMHMPKAYLAGAELYLLTCRMLPTN